MINQENQGMEKEFDYLEEFPSTTWQTWYDEVIKGLKGAPYEKVLLTQTPEGITLKPIYTQEDVKDNPYLESLPGFAPYVRNTKLTGCTNNTWAVEQDIDITDPVLWNKTALEDLNKGQNALYLQIDETMLKAYSDVKLNERQIAKNGLQIGSYEDFKNALKDIHLESIRLDINAHSTALAVSEMLSKYAQENKVDLKKVEGSLSMDPISSLAKYGKLPYSWKESMDQMAQLINWANTNAPQFKCIMIDGTVWNNAGASANQELAYVMASSVIYLKEMLDRGLDINDVAPHFMLSLGVGKHMFMEISKLRAARILWSQIIDSFGGNEEAQKTFIYSRTSEYNKTWYDPWVNILRTTTETFSAVVGSCDALNVTPFDTVVKSSDEFSRRLARNQQSILLEEAHLNAVVDPAGGSWYVETLTYELAQKSWELFQNIEKVGGILEALKNETIQKQINESHNLRLKNLATRKETLIGTTVYANLIEKALEDNNQKIARKDLTKSEIANKCNHVSITTPADLTIQPLPMRRLAETVETLRNAAENGAIPKAFVATVGTFVQLKPRVDFATGFFQVSGFDVINDREFADADQAIAQALTTDAKVIIICSTDDNYPELVPDFMSKLKAKAKDKIVVVAGYPKDYIEAFTKEGVDFFIHVKSDIIQTLSDILKRIGVL